MSDTLKPNLQACLNGIAAAARRGDECPSNGCHGLSTRPLQALAALGIIRVKLYANKRRVIQILAGEHAGLSTAKVGGNLIRVIDSDGSRDFCGGRRKLISYGSRAKSPKPTLPAFNLSTGDDL